MQRITLSADDLIAVSHERSHHPEPLVQRKMEVLWLKHHGLPHHDIARLAGVSRASVTRYLAQFLHGGLAAIRRFPFKARPRNGLDRSIPYNTSCPSAGGVVMDLAPEVVALIRRTADGFPWGPARRRYMADTVVTLNVSQRQACLL